MQKLNNHQKSKGTNGRTPWKTRPQKVRCNGKTQHTCTCTHDGIAISFVDESIHVIHKLGATWLGAAGRYCTSRYTVRIGHKGIGLCKKRQHVLHQCPLLFDGCYHLVVSHQAHRDSGTTRPLSNCATCHFVLP